MNYRDYAFTAFVDWLFYRRRPPLIILGSGILLIMAEIAAWAFQVAIPTSNGPLVFSLNMQDGLPALVSYAILILAFILVGVGLTMAIVQWRGEGRKRLFVLEFRGLRDWNGSPLVDAISRRRSGRPVQVLIDLRQRVDDGYIVDPQAAVSRLMSLRGTLDQSEDGLDRRDISYVAGGLAPVPLTFLAGILIDDESPIQIMDWNRHSKKWRELDDKDDGKRFEISGLESIASNQTEVVLAVSASYHVDIEGVVEKCGQIPIVQMELTDASTDCHWSEVKQQELAKQFFDVALSLGNKGIERIHLFIAGANSVVFRLGTIYDKKNLPSVVVYQYERGHRPPYPWAVEMPVAGKREPDLQYFETATGD